MRAPATSETNPNEGGPSPDGQAASAGQTGAKGPRRNCVQVRKDSTVPAINVAADSTQKPLGGPGAREDRGQCLGKLEEGTSLCYTCNSSLNLKLFQNEIEISF